MDRIITTDSLPTGDDAWTTPVERVSLAPLLADVVGRLQRGEALGDLRSRR